MGYLTKLSRRGSLYLANVNDSKQGGAFIQQITSNIDRGPVAMMERYEIPREAKLPIDYENYNNIKGEELINKFLDQCLKQEFYCELSGAQPSWESTYYPRLLTKNAWINWNWLGNDIFKFCVAFDSPYPGQEHYLIVKK